MRRRMTTKVIQQGFHKTCQRIDMTYAILYCDCKLQAKLTLKTFKHFFGVLLMAIGTLEETNHME